MKKMVALIISAVVLMCSISAGAQTDFLTQMYTNYTGEYTVSMSFEGGDEVLALLKELEMPAEVENFVDIKTLLETLLSMESRMLLQADMSDDMKSVKVALTAESLHNIDVNKNLNVGINAKTGIWIEMDVSDEEKPVFRVIYSYPYTNKYMVIDALEAVDEEEKAELVKMLSSILNKEFITAVNTYSVEVLKKYADIKYSAGKCIIKIDNDGLIGMVGEVMPYICGQMRPIMESVGADAGETDYIMESLESFSLEGIKLLGDKGITYTYTLKNGKISAVSTDADICIDISSIYKADTGMEWDYIASGELEFKVKASVAMSKIGTTSVTFPKLTDENSFSFADMLPQYEEPAYVEDVPEYPLWWASGYSSTLPVIDGEIYVPLRMSLESAYAESVSIAFDNGVITAQSEYFPSFKSLVLTVGSNKVYADGNEFATGAVLLENGTTYVSSKLFEELFGWELSGANYDMLTSEYWYEFYTE